MYVQSLSNFLSFLIPGLKITPADFNLRSYEVWSHKIELSWKDEPVLKNVVGKLAANVNVLLGSLCQP